MAGSPDSVENFPLPPGGKRPEREGAQGQELVATLQRRLAPTLTRLPQAGGDLPAFVSSRAEPGRVGSFAAHVSGVPAGSWDNMAAHVSGVPAGGVDNIAVHPTVPVSFSFPGGGRLERGVSHGQELAIALQRHPTPTLTRLPQRGGDLVNLLVLSTPVNLQTAPEVSQGTAPAPAGPPPRPAGTGMEQQSAAGAEGTRQSPEELERLVDKLLRKLWRQLTVERERRGWQRWP